MKIEESIAIDAPLPVVWRVFSTFEEWGEWNTVCENCCLLEGDEMDLGACFSFTLRPYRIPLTIAPRIVKCEPGQEVIWAGSRLGVHAEHVFRFEERDGRVILTSIEEFKGVMFHLSRIIRVPTKLHRLTRRLLAGIKAQAESCSAR